MRKDKRATLRLHEEQWQALEKIAKEKRTSVSQQLREAMEKHILIEKSPNSLSYTRKEISKKPIVEKIKILSGLILLIIAAPIIFNVWLGIAISNPCRIALATAIPLAFWALFYNNVIKKYRGRTLSIILLILVVSIITIFQLNPCHQDLFKTFLVWFCRYLTSMFIFLFIGVKIYGAKID